MNALCSINYTTELDFLQTLLATSHLMCHTDIWNFSLFCLFYAINVYYFAKGLQNLLVQTLTRSGLIIDKVLSHRIHPQAMKWHGLVQLCMPMPSMMFNSPAVSCILKLFRAIKGYPWDFHVWDNNEGNN